MRVELVQSQKQTLSQNMIQSVEILQMSSVELADYIKEQSMGNPVMDLDEHMPENKQEERLKKLEWLTGLDEQNRAYYRYDQEDEDKDNYLNNISAPNAETLKDVLIQQLLSNSYSKEEDRVFEYIADNLDTSGFLKLSVAEMAEQLGSKEEIVKNCLDIMKELEPVGVCAYDVKECLCLQLKKNYEDCEVELAIIQDGMELLGKKQLQTLAKIIHVPVDRIKLARDRICTLNPKPAQGYSTGEMTQYIVPDAVVVKFKDYFEILLNDYSCPSFHISKEYMQMLKTEPTAEVKDYLSKKIEQAEQIQKCIIKRNSTLMNLVNCIVKEQQDFFRKGELYLRPFRMSEAAELLSVHESTISRAIKNKYLQCCWGTYPLGYFFPKGLQNTDEESVASLHVKEELRKMMEEENKKHPLSDQQMADLFAKRGTKISRRTVAKYREELGFANCRERKE